MVVVSLPSILLTIRPYVVTLFLAAATISVVPLLPKAYSHLGPLYNFTVTVMARGVTSETQNTPTEAKRVDSVSSTSSATMSTEASKGSHSSSRNTKGVGGGSQSLSQRFASLTVPHQFFLHFYVFAATWNLICLLATLPTNPSLELLLLLSLFELHTIRRVLETKYVARFSPSAQMHLVLYLSGLL